MTGYFREIGEHIEVVTRKANMSTQLSELLDRRAAFRARLQMTDRDHKLAFADFVDLLASAIRAEGYATLNEDTARRLQDVHERCLRDPRLTRHLLHGLIYGTPMGADA